MNEPPVKMLLKGLLFSSLLLSIISYPRAVSAEPSAAPSSSAGASPATAYHSGFISNPSIYTYTVAAPSYSPLERSQQQQLKQSHSNDVVRDSVYRSGASRRNFYYTNNFDAGDGAQFAALDNTVQRTATTTTTTASSRASTTIGGSSATPTQPAPQASGCTVDRLAVYKVVLHTYWTRDLFPKHYPDWRPTAQWTRTIGRTHDASYALYHLGQQATAGVRQFAETGKSEVLDSVAGAQQQQNTGNSFTPFVASALLAPTTTTTTTATASVNQQQQQQQQRTGDRSVFDDFNIPAILNGAGRSEAKFFVDSNHSLVSLMTRIVPSPDWFIGVDSFQLCVGGSWIDTVTVELDPLDAGTDNGFTFTAPNWPTSPQGVIYRITSRYPAHPAGSFFYPKSKRLPPIATFQFIKLKEYELSEVFNFAEDDRKYETVKTQTHLESEHNHVEMNNELSASIERERQNEVSSSSSAPTAAMLSERDRIRSKLLAKMNPIYNNSAVSGYASGGVIPKNDKNALMQNIVSSYRRSSSASGSVSSSSSLTASRTSKRRRTKGGSRDCRVGHWSEWSPCSKTCGIGEMHRYRKVIKHGKRGGRPCPALQESKWCGSEKGCHTPASYFNWSNT